MNYEIQWKRRMDTVWYYWSSTHSKIKEARQHIAYLRVNHPTQQFRIVRVTRKAVKG